MSNFIIYALARSRTAWCSKFLTYKDHTCGHELSVSMRTPEDIRNYFAKGNTGSAETGVAQAHWLIEKYCPDIKQVVIHRDVNDVVNSLLEVDLTGVAYYDKDLLFKHMSYAKRTLDSISKRPGVLSINYSDLNKFEVCERLFEHCLPYEFDIKHWGRLKNQNIQANTKDHFRYFHQHKTEINQFKKLCKLELIHLRKTEPNNPIWKDYK